MNRFFTGGIIFHLITLHCYGSMKYWRDSWVQVLPFSSLSISLAIAFTLVLTPFSPILLCPDHCCLLIKLSLMVAALLARYETIHFRLLNHLSLLNFQQGLFSSGRIPPIPQYR